MHTAATATGSIGTSQGASPAWLLRGGHCGNLLAQRDWSATSLGAIETWPASLNTALGIVLLSPVPIVMLWGEDGIMLYNDAYSIFAGGRHPELFGSKVREGWPEVAAFNDNVMKVCLGGGTLAYQDHELTLYRNGRAEQVWMNLDYSPVFDEAGQPAGVIAIVIETTQRVQADRRLSTERERFLQAFEQAPGFIVSMRGPEHRVEFVNAAHRRVFGSQDWAGKTIREAFPDVSDQGYFEMIDRVYATGERVSVVAAPVRFRQPSGDEEERLMTFVCEAMRDSDGRVVGVLCEGSDVTEAERAERALRASEERFRTALEIQTVGAVYLDGAGVLIDANAAFQRMSGYSAQDIASGELTWERLTAPDYIENSRRAFAELKEKGETTPYEKEYRRKDGSLWWGLFAAKLLPDGTAFKFVIDITDRKRVEAALTEKSRALEALNYVAAATAAEQDLSQIVQLVVDAGVELCSAQFGAFFYNVVDEAGESYMLYSLSGAPRSAFEGFPMPRNTALFAPTFGGEGVIRSDDIKLDPRYGHNTPRKGMPEGHLPVTSYLAVPVIARDGEVIGGLFFGHPQPARFSEQHESLIVGLAAHAAVAIENARLIGRVQESNELLEQRVAERTAELGQANQALRQAQKMEAIGQLTGGIAHDFNNLLAGISGSLELLERRIAQGRLDGVDRFIDAAQTSARRAAALTQRLLAFSRRQTLDPKPTAVNRLVFGMEELINRTVGPAIKVEVVGAAGLWPIKVDAAQLESALLNLAINARDAMPGGGQLTIETANKWLDARAARERDLAPGQYISICVSDSGTGIPKDIVDKIFDPFFTTKPIGQGTGLGLSMIHGFVRQSGGQVRVYTEAEHGTTMCLYFPRHIGEVDSEAPREPHAVPDIGAGETVLIIDDEPTIRMLIAEVLAEAGYTAIEAEDGPAGLKILNSEARIDLLITDVGLPGGMNGRQVADAARVSRPGLKVLFITGYAENAAIGNGHLEPGMDVLTKPFVMADLANKIGDMIDSVAPP
ncbi:PAS domain S-box protein [Hydrocarboniphaga sp.]|uniref:PAS domain-containing hybrid sensor histidine kinase/response regulator n=1 Tax=Hydrocarboniphaga sp. TaxID=2033016 RepID=UPI003D0DCAAC